MFVARLVSTVATTGVRMRAAALAVGVTTAIAIAYEALRQDLTAGSALALLLFYGGSTAIIIAFSVWTATDIGLPSLLCLSTLDTRSRLVRWVILGVGLGFVLAGASVLLSGGADSPLQPWFWRRIQTPLGVALFSARAALLEETFFRLFLIPFLVSVALRSRAPRHRLELRSGNARATRAAVVAGPLLILLACTMSSAMFGLAHPFNPVGAVALAPLLAVAYLWGGWESSVTAHFVANMILLQFYY